MFRYILTTIFKKASTLATCKNVNVLNRKNTVIRDDQTFENAFKAKKTNYFTGKNLRVNVMDMEVN